MAGQQNQLPWKQKNKKISAVQPGSLQQEEATKHRVEKEEENIGRLKLYLQSEVNTVHKFFCLRNSIYVHVINDNVTH